MASNNPKNTQQTSPVSSALASMFAKAIDKANALDLPEPPLTPLNLPSSVKTAPTTPAPQQGPYPVQQEQMGQSPTAAGTYDPPSPYSPS